jgi:hypothetical protein
VTIRTNVATSAARRYGSRRNPGRPTTIRSFVEFLSGAYLQPRPDTY